MVPAPHEQAELEATLARLLMGDDPPSEVLLVVADGDARARAVAEDAAARHPDLITVVDEATVFEPEPVASFSVMVPAPHERAELEATLARLLMGDDPPSEVLLVVADGDARARAVAEDAAARHPDLITVVDEATVFEPEPVASFSVMVPAPHERAELEATLARLLMGDDPPSEVLLVVADGDARARAVAEDAAARHPDLITVVDEATVFEPEPVASFSVMVPAPHERAELEATLARLLMGDDPPSEVLLVVADGDARARAVAEDAAARHPDLITVVDEATVFEPEPVASFSVMVPAPHERAELEATLARLLMGDDPPSEVLLVVADGDARARAVAEDAAARHPDLITVVDEATVFEPEPVASFSVMVPAPHERAELEATLARLLMGDDPPSEVLLVVADGDAQARAVAEDAAARHPDLITVVDEATVFEPEPVASFSVMVPAPHEQAELEAALARLLMGDDPPSEVLLVVADGDAQARAVAEDAAARHP